MKRVNSISFDDAEAIIHVAFPYFTSPEELVGMFFKWFAPQENPNGFAVLPFINGVTQPLTDKNSSKARYSSCK